MKAIILSGGFGTRLRPLTLTIPKTLLPLVNRPFLEYQLDLLRKYEINEAFFCLNYRPQLFKKYFNQLRTTNYELQINSVIEKFPLGTGGAVKNAFTLRKIKGTVLVFNGDVLTDLNLGEMLAFHNSKKAKITIALVGVKDPSSYGLIKIDKFGKIIKFLEKPLLKNQKSKIKNQNYNINAGIYIFEPEVLDYVPEGINYSVERGLFPLLLKKRVPMYGYIHNGYWLDIGTTEKYLQAHSDLMNGRIKNSELRIKKLGKEKLVVGEKTKIPDSVQVIGNVCIGKNCFVGKNVTLKDSVILNHVYLGEGIKLEKSIIGNNCRIEANAVLGPGTVLGDGSVIKKYSQV